MKLNLHNLEGKVVRQINVRDDLFSVPMNAALVHQVAVAQLSNARQGTAKTKTRSQVSGGGAKPRPQKYTGSARQGSIRSPQWRGGGVVFGPDDRNYRRRTSKRMRRQTLQALLSDKVRSNNLVLVEDLAITQKKTSEIVKVLGLLPVSPSVLLLADGVDPTVLRCARNVPKLKMLPASLLNPVDLLSQKSVVMTLEALETIENLWGGSFTRPRPSVANVVGG